MPATAYEPETGYQEHTPTLSELASGILNDVQDLIKQQMMLLRSEFKEDLRRTRQVAQCIAAGIFLVAISAVLLLVAGVQPRCASSRVVSTRSWARACNWAGS